MGDKRKEEAKLQAYIRSQIEQTQHSESEGYWQVVTTLQRISNQIQASCTELQKRIRVYDGYRLGEVGEPIKLIGDLTNLTGYVMYLEDAVERVWLDKKNRRVYKNRYQPKVKMV